MQVVHTLSGLTDHETPLCLALGVFDGLHVGHQAVIGQAMERAKEAGGISGVVTFDPHPIQVLAPHRAPEQIFADAHQKEIVLRRAGLDVLFLLKFTSEFAAIEAEDFLARLAACGNLTALAVGEGWNFGKGRRGNVAMMEEFCRERGIILDVIPPVLLDGERVSSTRIREALREGRLGEAARLLGREFTVTGEVRKGRQLGRTIGFPTANLDPGTGLLPPDGVWSVDVRWEEEPWRGGVANLGIRPTVESEGTRLLEVHLPDWQGDLYGKELEVRFRKFIRGEKKFDDVAALRRQIEDDVRLACR